MTVLATAKVSGKIHRHRRSMRRSQFGTIPIGEHEGDHYLDEGEKDEH